MKSATVLVALTLSGTSWAAEQTPFFPPTPVAGWTVIGVEQSCSMLRDYPGGARLNFNMAKPKGQVVLIAQSERWQGIIEDALPYPLSVAFDDKRVEKQSEGFVSADSAAPQLGMQFMTEDEYQLIRTSRRMSLALGDFRLGSFPLPGIAAALDALERCAARIPQPATAAD